MDLSLSDTQRLIQGTARAFARERVAPQAFANDRAKRFPDDLIREMGKLGLLGVNIDERYGGAGAGLVAYALAKMEIAEADSGVAVTMGVTHMVAAAICRHGNPAQMERYVPKLLNGEWLGGAFALTEPGSGSDAASLKTTAVERGDRWVINGQKVFITTGEHCGVAIVFARTDPTSTGSRGITAFLVERGYPGYQVLRREDKLGQHSSNTVALGFQDCEVPADNVLGEVGQGFKVAMGALEGGRVGVAAQAVGIGRAALAAALRYASDRQQFGKPIGEYQAIQWKLADMSTELEAARLLTLRAAARKDAGKSVKLEGSMAKLFATEAAVRITNEAVQIHGGYGFIEEYHVSRYLRDARVTTLYEGTSEIQRIVIAREILQQQ